MLKLETTARHPRAHGHPDLASFKYFIEPAREVLRRFHRSFHAEGPTPVACELRAAEPEVTCLELGVSPELSKGDLIASCMPKGAASGALGVMRPDPPPVPRSQVAPEQRATKDQPEELTLNFVRKGEPLGIGKLAGKGIGPVE
jgi:hypothetical protein